MTPLAAVDLGEIEMFLTTFSTVPCRLYSTR
jgi:hypothetical protein